MADAMELLEKRRNRKRKRSACANELDRMGSATIADHTVAYTTCQKCGHMLEKKIVDASVMICPSCSVSEDYLESTRDGLSFNEDVEFVSNTYKRQNHMQAMGERPYPTLVANTQTITYTQKTQKKLFQKKFGHSGRAKNMPNVMIL